VKYTHKWSIFFLVTDPLMQPNSRILRMLSKVDCKISVSFGLIQTFEVSNLATVKV